MFSCEMVKKTVYMLMGEEALQGKIWVAGGIVPWLLSGADSGRLHGDLDVVVQMEHMPFIRAYLQEKGYYRAALDSQNLAFNKARQDYGVEAVIQTVPVSFGPFEVCGTGIMQRNFALERFGGFDALFTAVMEGIVPADYITHYTLKNGLRIGAYTLEAVRAAKENTGREKDLQDLREIERIGFDQARYERVKPSMQTMRVEYIAKEP